MEPNPFLKERAIKKLDILDNNFLDKYVIMM